MASKWRIVSGGQTGVDRAALDAARSLGLEYGGFVPRGRRTEDGALPEEYAGMPETESANYAVRTRLNLRAADATLILTRGVPDGGTLLTFEAAKADGKPVLLVDLSAEAPDEAARRVRSWLDGLAGGSLNIAGPRESGQPGIHFEARRLLERILGPGP